MASDFTGLPGLVISPTKGTRGGSTEEGMHKLGEGDLETQRENKQHMQKKSSVGRLRGNCNGAES